MKKKTAILAIFLFLACSSLALADDCCFDWWICHCDLRNDFGRAYTLAMASQILNPDAEMNLGPVEGLGGRAAEITMKKYEASFAAPLRQSSQSGGGGMTSVAISQSPGDINR